MKRTVLKSVFSFVLAASLAVTGVFAAEPDVYGKQDFFPEDQRNITIIDAVHAYDLNPHTASYTSESQILTGLYEGLFSYNPVTLEPEYALCKSYKMSRDKKRWTFVLREDAKFSNGEDITAATIRDSWLTLLKTPNAPFASLIDCVTGASDYRNGIGSMNDVRIEARDSYTLVVHLTEPTEQLPRILCHHAFSAVSRKKNVYSGPFVLRSYKNGRLELSKNKNFHDADTVVIPGITIIQSDDAEENAFLFNTGAADWVMGSVNAMKILNGDAVRVSAEFGTSYLFFKIKNKPWNNAAFRLALLEAIPYTKLRELYSVPATTLVYPLMGYPSVPGWDDWDAPDALAMMKEARKQAGLSQDEIIPLVFAIVDSPLMQGWAEVLKKAWEPLGVSLIVQTATAEEYNAQIPTWNADLFSYSWIGDYADPTAFLELFRSNSTLNVARYSNADFDSLLNDAGRTSDAGERYKLLSKAETLLLDDGMVIPVSHPVALNVINTSLVGGWTTNALDLHPLRYMYIRRRTLRIPNTI
ncbi:MAG TPA: peptide ABC transporter substrate-binding protein [Treponema sp.]|nr:peptide ABC transporter substrate-binding protein [Treponema sp.]